MWRCVTLCIVLTICRDVRGDIGDQMAEVIQKCCNDGSGYARNHTGQDCNISVAPPDVPSAFGTICVMAQAQCCKEYYKASGRSDAWPESWLLSGSTHYHSAWQCSQHLRDASVWKQEDCDGGIDVALSTGKCVGTKDSTKVCCDECSRGSTAGLAGGNGACVSRAHGGNADELLSDDAYRQCCTKTAKEGPPTFTPKPEVTLASICEDFAPNELCAHHCIPSPGSYTCECNPGFMLMADGRNCKEVVKNRCKPRNPCQHKCNDNGIDVLCSCRRGYELMPDGKSCQDINECQLDINVCLPGTQCYNIQGSYRCTPQKNKINTSTQNKGPKGQCPAGFARNIKNNVCDDINECKLPHPPCPAYLCANTVGGYKCGGVSGDPVNLDSNQRAGEDRCPPGFTMGPHGECEDVDECASLKDDCNRLSQFCVNTHSSFYCQDMASKHCPPGFKIDAMTNRCEDINECEDRRGSEVCRADQVCVNQLGQYDCKQKPTENGPSRDWCPDGMRIDPTTNICEDINECVEGTHLCDQHQSCLNTNGSFECHCKLGYELDTTTGACVDVNECATQQHDCITNTQRCDNTVGSYLCIRIISCGTGYILQHSTGKCEDVDECALGTHNCAIAGSEYQCMNIPGSFRCVRKRASSTTTTQAPHTDDEYEYYDDDETDPPPGVDAYSSPSPLPSSSPPSSSTTEAIQTPEERKPEERKPEQPSPEERKPEERKPEETIPEEAKPEEYKPEERKPVEYNPGDNNIPAPTYEQERGDAEGDSRKPIDYVPEVPRYVAPLYTPEPPRPTDPPATSPQPTPDISYSEPSEPANRPDIVRAYEPNSESPERKETPDSTYYETRPEKPVSSNEIPEERSTERDSIEPVTEQRPEQRPIEEASQRPTYSPYSPTVRTFATPPHAVLVNVGQETATVPVEKKEASNCPSGFEVNDNGGCFDIDECATNRHSCSGFTETCHNTIGGYLCNCAPGFRRDLVTGACDLIVTTSSTTSSTTSTTTELPTLPPSTTPEPVSSTSQRGRELFFGYPDGRPLTSRPFRPRNWCDAGFHLNAQTERCEDINECTNGQANCASVEICVNTRGGYRCECPPNWRLDDIRHRCVPVRNEGVFPPGYANKPAFPPADPQETFGHGSEGTNSVDPEITHVEDRGTILKCPWGYRLGDDNNCVDVDECSTGEAKCGFQQICTNLAGGYTCSCPRGHKLIGDHECEDVDECALAGNMSICSQKADCVNTLGSYQCKCHNGFRSAPVNDKVCVDVDECSESRAGSLCQHRCSNVWGSYRCACHRGYRLSPDNRTCVDVNECVQFKAKFPCVGNCLNEPGSYRCSCPIGYRLSEDKRSCIDIDECETGEASCQTGVIGGTSHVCVNTRGSYHCHRVTCPLGYELENKHRCTKTERVCRPGDWECAHQPTTISYNFITFVSKLYVPDSNVKLFTMRGPAWPYTELTFTVRLVSINAPPSVKDRADINAFLLTQSGHEAVISLVRPLEGPQSIELELSMELHSREQFGGIAIAKIFINVSEYEF